MSERSRRTLQIFALNVTNGRFIVARKMSAICINKVRLGYLYVNYL